MSDTHSISRRNILNRARLGALAGLALLAPGNAIADNSDGSHTDTVQSQPSVIVGRLADAVVRVEGGDTCSGTPISGTRYVVTAAHCVLDPHGNPAQRVVIRDGIERTARQVIVDTRYHDDPSPQYDAAVIVLEAPFPGPGAAIAASLPTAGSVTVVGFQRVNADGELLRGATLRDRPVGTDGLRFGAHDRLPSGCEGEAADLEVLVDRVKIECGLIPGSSGGALLTVVDDQVVLTGIISTVTTDMTANALVPLGSLWALLDDAAQHTFEVTAPPPARASQLRV